MFHESNRGVLVRIPTKLDGIVQLGPDAEALDGTQQWRQARLASVAAVALIVHAQEACTQAGIKSSIVIDGVELPVGRRLDVDALERAAVDLRAQGRVVRIDRHTRMTFGLNMATLTAWSPTVPAEPMVISAVHVPGEHIVHLRTRLGAAVYSETVDPYDPMDTAYVAPGAGGQA